jgi:hypothetical protein
MTEKYFNIADKIISKAYPGSPGFWGEKRIPNYGILRKSIAEALEETVRSEHKNEQSTSSKCSYKCSDHACTICY